MTSNLQAVKDEETEIYGVWGAPWVQNVLNGTGHVHEGAGMGAVFIACIASTCCMFLDDISLQDGHGPGQAFNKLKHCTPHRMCT